MGERNAKIVELDGDCEVYRLFDTGIAFHGRKLYMRSDGTSRDKHLRELMRSKLEANPTIGKDFTRTEGKNDG